MTNSARLYHAPTACSSVTQIALEASGLNYDLAMVDLAGGEQRSAGFLAVNPRGKVPALDIDGSVMTENAAILFWLAQRFPESALRPAGVDETRFLSDLVWCSATLHPMVRQIRAPQRFTDDDPSGVRAHGLSHFAPIAAMLDKTLGHHWWYGEDWSIIDAYLAWIASVAASHLDLSGYSGLTFHIARNAARPEARRAQAREAEAVTGAR